MLQRWCRLAVSSTAWRLWREKPGGRSPSVERRVAGTTNAAVLTVVRTQTIETLKLFWRSRNISFKVFRNAVMTAELQETLQFPEHRPWPRWESLQRSTNPLTGRKMRGKRSSLPLPQNPFGPRYVQSLGLVGSVISRWPLSWSNGFS